MLTRLKPALQVLPTVGRHEVAPDRRDVQVRYIEFDKVIVRRPLGFCVEALCYGANKDLINIPIVELLLSDEAFSDQSIPIHRRKHIRFDTRNQIGVPAFGIAQFGPRHLQRRCQQALIENTH